MCRPRPSNSRGRETPFGSAAWGGLNCVRLVAKKRGEPGVDGVGIGDGSDVMGVGDQPDLHRGHEPPCGTCCLLGSVDPLLLANQQQRGRLYPGQLLVGENPGMTRVCVVPYSMAR
jgi:hypothetical protein